MPVKITFSTDINIFCFGEMLHDVYSYEKIPGGAPMNVAVHLAQNGFRPGIISCVGEDQEGDELLDFIRSYGVLDDYVQRHPVLPTGFVKVDLLESHDVVYDIGEPVAWDNIEDDLRLKNSISEKDLFIFGSLASRRPTSYETLCGYLEKDVYKVMDMNLRNPFIYPSKLENLMHKADLLKINEQELEFLTSQYNLNMIDSATDFLIEKFSLDGVLVTMGSRGAYANFGNESQKISGVRIDTLRDTVGSGDAFLAGFLSKYLKNLHFTECLHYGCIMGAFVATKNGACPKYSLNDIEGFYSSSIKN